MKVNQRRKYLSKPFKLAHAYFAQTYAYFAQTFVYFAEHIYTEYQDINIYRRLLYLAKMKNMFTLLIYVCILCTLNYNMFTFSL